MRAFARVVLALAFTVFTVAPVSASPSIADVRAALRPAFRPRRVSLIAMGIALAADVVTTQQGLQRGCRESNPIYGGRPSLGMLWVTHGVIEFGAVEARTPIWANTLGAVLFGAVALHNASLRCR